MFVFFVCVFASVTVICHSSKWDEQPTEQQPALGATGSPALCGCAMLVFSDVRHILLYDS